MSKIVLPGSEGEEAGPGGGSGRLSAADAVTLAQVAHWWRFRLARADAADPLESAFGGVDDSGAVRTVGLAAATVVFPRPLAVPPGGVGLWVVALGVADPPSGGQVYSLAGLCHFSRAAGGARPARPSPPAGAPDSTELRAVVTGPPPGDTPTLQIVGVSGQTIDWKVEVYRVERNDGGQRPVIAGSSSQHSSRRPDAEADDVERRLVLVTPTRHRHPSPGQPRPRSRKRQRAIEPHRRASSAGRRCPSAAPAHRPGVGIVAAGPWGGGQGTRRVAGGSERPTNNSNTRGMGTR